MSWVAEPKRSWAEWAAIRLLKVGPIPHHLAFIMDGNRRFARQLHKDTLEGHAEGFQKLTEVLSWCRDLNITEVTVYAFSIENFKRAKSEVEGLMHLAEEKFVQLLEETERLKEHGVCVRVIGQLNLLTEKLQHLVAKAILATKDNKRCYLNLALAYTSREEISTALKDIQTGVTQSRIHTSDVTETLLEHTLYTEGRSDPDLLIRTSGEVRLSDFLLWQSGLTHLFFTKVLWPQISIWHLLAAVFHYQRHHHTLLTLRREDLLRRLLLEEENDRENWLKEGQEGTITDYTEKRKQRQDNFLITLRGKRQEYLCQLAGLQE